MDQQKNNIPLADEKIQELAKKAQTGSKDFFDKNKSSINEAMAGIGKEEVSEKISPEAKSPIKNLRTYQGDVAEIIKNQNASVLTIAMAEKNKKEEAQKKEPRKKIDPQIKKNFLLATTSLILIFLGISAIAGFYIIQKREPVIISESSQSSSILPFQEKKSYEVSAVEKNKLIEIVEIEKNSWGGKAGEILYMEFVGLGTTQPITPSDFLEGLKTRSPSSLIRSFNKSMMFGLFKENFSYPFLLLEISSFENAFDGMLRWEQNIYDDIGVIFSNKTVSVINALPEENTENGEDDQQIINFEAQINSEFEDLTIKNKDARILKNELGETVLLYSFLDGKTLLITGNESVFRSFIEKTLPTRFLR